MAILSDNVLTWEDVFGETYLESALKLIKDGDEKNITIQTK